MFVLIILIRLSPKKGFNLKLIIRKGIFIILANKVSNLRISEKPACGKIRFFWKNIYPCLSLPLTDNCYIGASGTQSLVYI